ncbi:MAG TPA: hypothetical protein PLK04_10210 [Bacillota bacterium]|nr:hypothetical protein [Bacillota bacterium]HPZ14595.1 hypothetical protein [Bacillota bacterium]
MAKKSASSELNPRALTIADLSKVLTDCGFQPVTVDMIRKDIADGAPVNADGTIDIVRFTAWLVKEVRSGRRVEQAPCD